MTLVICKTWIVNPCHTRVVVEELRHLFGIAAMALHAHGEGLKTEIEKEGILRSGNGTKVTHELGNEFGGVTHFAECLGIGKSVV